MNICTTSPPSSGVAQIMITGLYDHLVKNNENQDDKVAAFVDAQRLAYADRDHYFGDPDEVDIPLDALLNPTYLKQRANERFDPSEKPTPGNPALVIDTLAAIPNWGKDNTLEAAGTTHLSIVDENGKDCAAGVQGEVWISGKHVMLEYWNRPDATAETITSDGWLRTGDVASVDEEGFIYIQDRIKDMIISGSENVYPAEIENIILTHPAVTEVAVIGQPSEKWGESPFAVVVRKDEALTEVDILSHCQGKLGRFKVPKGAVFVDVIPRNANGKVLKRELRKQFPGPAIE